MIMKRDGRVDGQCNYYMPPKVPFGHKKGEKRAERENGIHTNRE